MDWLRSIQPANIQAVNDELNQLYLKAKDFESLGRSVSLYDQFDAIKLAETIESSESPEFRRISAIIFRKNKNYKKSIKLLIQDRFFLDAIETGLESNSKELARNLMQYFAQNNLKEMFLMTTHQCFDLVSSDDVLELSQRYNLAPLTTPYRVQVEKDRALLMESLRVKIDQIDKKLEETQGAKRPLDLNSLSQKLSLGGQTMLTNGQNSSFGDIKPF